jgi:hypothetical protein
MVGFFYRSTWVYCPYKAMTHFLQILLSLKALERPLILFGKVLRVVFKGRAGYEALEKNF